MSVKFIDNRVKVFSDFNKKLEAFMEESKDSLASQAGDNCNRVTGQLADSFTTDSLVEMGKDIATAYIGSSVEYSIYYEQGTGEYALNGDGRQGGWVYFDSVRDKFVWTTGQTPKRPVYRAFIQKKEGIKRRATEIFSD